jgi:chemotaxis protein CheZ
MEHKSFFDRIGEIEELIGGIRHDVLDLYEFLFDPSIPHSKVHELTLEIQAALDEMMKSTCRVLDTAQIIDTILKPTPLYNEILPHITDINEACMFQDITGQRLSKIRKTLNELDAFLKQGQSMSTSLNKGDHKSSKPEKTLEESLLNGPQLPGGEKNQAEIDKLMKDL